VKTYPVFLVGLEQRRCLVIGGGTEAERKIAGLLECGAAVSVLDADPVSGIRSLAEAGRVHWIERGYRAGDLAGAFLVIVAGPDRQTVERIWNEARERGTLVNVLDEPAHCSFIAGSVVRRGPLTVAVSTGGRAPALAVRLRERLERELGPEYAEFLELAADLRPALAARLADPRARRSLWYALVDSDVMELLRAGRRDLARRRMAELAGSTGAAAPTA
jgi:siroheme synthase-like protein